MNFGFFFPFWKMTREFLNLVVFISLFARESCGVDESKAFFNTVRRGHMIIKCEEKYGQQPAAKKSNNSGLLLPYNCINECEECSKASSFNSTSFEECEAACNGNGEGEPCRQGCEFFHNAVNSGNGSTGIWYDTRNVIVKRPYLICRTLTELLINFEVRLAEGSPNNVEPVGYILLWRTSESESWKTNNKFVCKSLF
ncbi:uncharacterized protein [Montipora foliosa]|uniref:uncharacterized protein n=1 Tax=Montipora foliosa TaxID=591990 RepID=UPI0035F1C049